MRYTSLNASEEKFLLTANNGEYNLRKISVPVPGEDLKLEGYLCTPANRSGYYHDSIHPKERIVIHYTAGNIKSDLSTLTSHNRHVSVPFVIARDGTIYQLFSSKFWSGHLGKGVGNTNTNNAEDKRTIGIELSNYGFLNEKAGSLETYYSRQKNTDGTFGPVDVYCSLTDRDAYEKLNTPFRQQSYYATHSDAQYQSLIILLRYLTAQYNIPRQFLPEDIRYQTANEVLNFKGIVTHVNYRSDGKWDIGPAFNWNAVIQGVQAAEFKPVIFRDSVPVTRGTGTEIPITSEEQVADLLPKAMDPAKENESYEEVPRSVEVEEDIEKDPSTPRKKKLFALLVGIDKYEGDIILNQEVSFPSLSGCVSDSKKMKAYLENDSSLIADVKLITNKQATKAEVVRLFKEHLSQAEEGDVALFFYSGHGTQEWADSTWTEDTDSILECIVCYYDNDADEFLLADKELRFLIHELAAGKPHIVSIFDCCHSADNTRNGAKVKAAFEEAVEKRVPYVFRKRKWDHFIFSKEISNEDIKQKGETALLPEGLHIQFSACESDESAVEVAGEGVFTKALLKVLRSSGGEVSYHALGGRIRQYLKNVYEQKPRIYVAGGEKKLLYSVFLDKSDSPKKIAFGEVIYNQEKGWKFTLGAIHGIGEHNKKITITDPEESDKIFEGEIGTIEIDSCEVNTKGKLNTDKIYNGSVEGLLTHTLRVNIQNTDGSLKNLQRLMDSLFEADQKYTVAEDDEEAAGYVVGINTGKYFITRPKDAFRPVAAPVVITGLRSAKAIAAQLKHISQWEFLKNLKNENERNKLPDDALKIEVISEETKKLLLDKNNTAVIHYKEKDGEWENTIRVRLTNTAPVNIYCAALYLTSDFSSFIEFLNPPVYLLEPENSVELSMDKNPVLKLEYNKVAKFYNWKEEVEYLKFIISTDVFDVQALSLEALPKPAIPGDRPLAGSRGINVSKDINKRKPEGWTTQTVTLRLQNPNTNKISAADLDAMLKDPEFIFFARGLYFDKLTGENTKEPYMLKQGIEIPDAID